MKKNIWIISSLFLVTACSQFPMQRHPGSGYKNYSDRSSGEVSLAELADRDPSNSKSAAALGTSSPLNASLSKNAQSNTLSPQEKQRLQRSIASMIEQNDITLGMDMDSVRESWGVPDQVFAAGEERHNNQVWKYTIPIQTSSDYYIEERVVQFQNGKVVGWKSK